jgi:AhpD family alkylhydroperoxidase
MIKFKIHTIETALEASNKIMEGAKAKYKFVPYLLGKMAEAPATLEAYTTLAGIFEKTDMSAKERQVIMMTVSRLNGCTYCMAAHSTTSLMTSVAEDVITTLRAGTALADPKLEALRQLTFAMTDERGWPSETGVQAFWRQVIPSKPCWQWFWGSATRYYPTILTIWHIPRLMARSVRMHGKLRKAR